MPPFLHRNLAANAPRLRRWAWLLLAPGLIGAEVPPADWPQFLGPERNGVYRGSPLAATWPTEGPRVVWQRELGAGFSGPAISANRLVIFHRVGDQATIDCCEADSGQSIWRAQYPTDYQDDFGFDNGPRATPAIAAGHVITYGAEGRLAGWSLADGKAEWSVNTAGTWGSRKGFFGRASSPLIEGGLVIVTVGGPSGHGVLAVDLARGELRWRVSDDEASYASPVAATIHGERVLLVLTREALLALRPTDGKLIFRHPWRPKLSASVSAATPLIKDDFIFISACYGAGAALLRYQASGPEVVWSNEESLSNHYATSVEHDGFLYGWHGRQESGCELRCVELKTGRVRWREAGLKAGSVSLAGTELIVLTEQGLLLKAPATPDGFKPTARAQVLPFQVRAFPALARGRLFARSANRLFCLDLAGAQ